MIDLKTKYDKQYIDVRERSNMPFQIFIGPRGTGKTFTALRGELNNDITGERFIYLRNSQAEAEAATTKYGNAFKKINSFYGTDVEAEFSSKLGMGAFYKNEKEDLIGYAFGLTTFAGKRSIDLSDAQRVIFEEFIPEKHVQVRKNRGEAFLNFYETCNRNRELEGEEPLRVYFLANAISLDDDILLALQVTDDIESMIRNGEKRRTIPERGVYIELVDVAVSEMKEDTALYRLGNTKFNNMALSADFKNARLNLIEKKFNQRDYTPYLSIEDICIYKHKANNTLHIAETSERARNHFLPTETLRFRTTFRTEYVKKMGANFVTFDSFETRNKIETLLKVTE